MQCVWSKGLRGLTNSSHHFRIQLTIRGHKDACDRKDLWEAPEWAEGAIQQDILKELFWMLRSRRSMLYLSICALGANKLRGPNFMRGYAREI